MSRGTFRLDPRVTKQEFISWRAQGSKLPVSDNRTVVHLSFPSISELHSLFFHLFHPFKNITDRSLPHPCLSTLLAPPPHFSIGFLYRTFQGSLAVWSVMEPVWHLHTQIHSNTFNKSPLKARGAQWLQQIWADRTFQQLCSDCLKI